MCVVAVKYIKKFGWVGAKNRDRNYSTSIKVVNSNRDGIQRLYIDDQTTRWTEGVNEYGLSIISASFSVKSDEKEGEKVLGKNKKKTPIVSPDGLAIRNALRRKTPKEAAKYLIEKQLAGATFIFNPETCYLLEGGFTVKKADATAEKPREYVYKLKEITQEDDHCVRTNHGIDMPNLGYSKNAQDDNLIAARKSSETRWEIVNNYLRDNDISDPYEFLEALSQKPNEDKFMNPIRTGNIKKSEMVTTGQLLLVAKERTLHYRPIYSAVSFDYKKLNSEEAKTFFEIISSRKLLSFKEFVLPQYK
jgi:hypothetical protein